MFFETVSGGLKPDAQDNTQAGICMPALHPSGQGCSLYKIPPSVRNVPAHIRRSTIYTCYLPFAFCHVSPTTKRDHHTVRLTRSLPNPRRGLPSRTQPRSSDRGEYSHLAVSKDGIDFEDHMETHPLQDFSAPTRGVVITACPFMSSLCPFSRP